MFGNYEPREFAWLLLEERGKIAIIDGQRRKFVLTVPSPLGLVRDHPLNATL